MTAPAKVLEYHLSAWSESQTAEKEGETNGCVHAQDAQGTQAIYSIGKPKCGEAASRR